jgi:hypothetical protein
MNTFNGTKSKLGVYNTDLLVKLLSVLGNDINFNVNLAQDKAFSLTLDDNSTTVNYMLADMAVIPPTPELKQLPPFQVTIKLTKEFIDKFIRAQGALPSQEQRFRHPRAAMVVRPAAPARSLARRESRHHHAQLCVNSLLRISACSSRQMLKPFFTSLP